ncbi:MAG: YtxH domain-containing protein [Bacteroidales bacterium]
MKNLSLLIAFAGGAIAGAVIGVMIAPDKGENIRKKVFDMAHDKGHEAKMKLKEFLEEHGVHLECCQLDSLVEELIDKDTPATKED